MNSHTAYKNNHTQTVGYWPAILDVKKRPSQKRLGRSQYYQPEPEGSTRLASNQ